MIYNPVEKGEDICALHISPVFNRDSILKTGLTPTPVKLEYHLEYFIENDLSKDDKVLYSWMSCDQNEKFIKDMIFCINYIHPRNALTSTWENSIDFKTLIDKNISSYNYMLYDIYEIKSKAPHYTNYLHVQEDNNSRMNTCYDLPSRYSHNDKLLVLYKETQKDIKIVGQAEYYYDYGYNIKIIR